MTNSTDFKALIGRVATGASLTVDESRAAFDAMMEGAVTPAQMGGFLMALRVRGETVDEITGGAQAMRTRALSIEAPEGAIDTCGTGGDAKGTFNISTAAALVAAGCGVPVAKHGNRALSSRSGSADLLAALGVTIDADMTLVREALWEANIGFLMAPRHHGAMRHVGPTRVELGTRTVFNLLGPLSNPAGAKRQVIGVFDPKWTGPMAEVLRNLGSERVWVVHGSDGTDELTTTGPSTVVELDGGTIRRFEVAPEDAGLHAGGARGPEGRRRGLPMPASFAPCSPASPAPPAISCCSMPPRRSSSQGARAICGRALRHGCRGGRRQQGPGPRSTGSSRSAGGARPPRPREPPADERRPRQASATTSAITSRPASGPSPRRRWQTARRRSSRRADSPQALESGRGQRPPCAHRRAQEGIAEQGADPFRL